MSPPEDSPREARIAVRLMPRASRTEIAGFRGEALIVRVTAPPVDDRANHELCRVLAKRLGIARGKVEITSGHRSRDKVVRVHGLSPDEAEDALLR